MTTSSINMVQKPPPPPSKFLDDRGYVSREWILFLSQLQMVANTAITSTNDGTLALFTAIAPQLLAAIEKLEDKVKALEVSGVRPQVQQKKQESITQINQVLSLTKKVDEVQIPSHGPCLLCVNMLKRIHDLEVLIATT